MQPFIFACHLSGHAGLTRPVFRVRVRFGYDRSTRVAGLCPARLSRPGLYLDTGLLGMGPGLWILLGAWHLGAGAFPWCAVDSRVLGMG